MALTQEDINNIVNGIVNTYTNQRIAYHGGYPGECTSPVKYYVENVTGQQAPYMANDRADGWGTNFPAELAPFFYHEAYQPGKAYPKGTILMWNSPPESHIAIVVYDNGSNTVEVFEQNADPDGSPCKTASRTVNNAYHSCTYALIPIVANPQPTPPPPPAPKYTVIETYPQGKQIQLNKQPTNLWGMNYDFQYMKDHPVEVHNQGEIWTVTNKVHHEDGYDYYRRDGQVDGFNVADCDDYTPPAAPLPFTPAEKYTLVTNVMFFGSAAAAKKHAGTAGALSAGDYYVIAKQDNAYNLSDNNVKDKHQWVNIDDNKVEDIPTQPVDIVRPVIEPVDPPPVTVTEAVPVKTLYYDWIDGVHHQPVWFHTQNVTEQRFKDLENPDTTPQVVLPPNKDVRFSMVTIKNGMDYYIPTLSLQRGNRHGIPATMLQPVSRAESFLDDTDNDLHNWADLITTPLKKTITYFEDIAPAKRNKLIYQGKQFIDGFRKGAKK